MMKEDISVLNEKIANGLGWKSVVVDRFIRDSDIHLRAVRVWASPSRPEAWQEMPDFFTRADDCFGPDGPWEYLIKVKYSLCINSSDLESRPNYSITVTGSDCGVLRVEAKTICSVVCLAYLEVKKEKELEKAGKGLK